MKFLKFTLFLLLSFTVGLSVQAQNSKYVGTWTLVDFKGDKCAKDQVITLKKDGTASYIYGGNTKGCKPQIMEYTTWKAGPEEVRTKKGKVKKDLLIIGENKDIMFLIIKKKGKSITVSADVWSGDTTTSRLLKFVKS